MGRSNGPVWSDVACVVMTEQAGGGGGEVLGLVCQMDTVMVTINPFSAGTVSILQNLMTTCHEP